MTLSLLLASPGVGFRSARHRLEQYGSFAVADVEDHLLGNDQNWEEYDRHIEEEPPRRDMLAFLDEHTRESTLEAWSVALGEALASLKKSEKTNRVLCFHPSLFNGRRSEFFSTISTFLLHQRDVAPVTRIVLLIDDIYDMWHRLGRNESDLYHFDTWHNRRLELEGRNEAQDVEPDQQTKELLRADTAVSILSQLLAWRRFDMIVVEQLSKLAPISVIGVKHPAGMLRDLLSGKIERTCYLSHPISDPRREHTTQGTWPAEVYECNKLATEALERSLALICPTAIDEFRFEPPTDRARPFDRLFTLRERWPPIGDPANLIVTGQDPQDLPDVVPVGDGTTGSLGMHARTIENLIRSEFPFRDHFLVAHTSGFLVYRPLSEGGLFSGGVAAEIRHFQDFLDDGDETRRALFLHTSADIDKVLVSMTDKRKAAAAFEIRSLVSRGLEERKFDFPTIRLLMEGEVRRPSDLDQGILTSQSKIVKPVLVRAAECSIFTTLTGLNTSLIDSPAIAIHICADTSSLDAQSLSNIFAFLKGETNRRPDRTSLRERIESYLRQDIADWAAAISGVPLVD